MRSYDAARRSRDRSLGNCKILRTSTIIVIVKIMVEVLKISLLLWCLRAAARTERMRDVVPSAKHYDSGNYYCTKNAHAEPFSGQDGSRKPYHFTRTWATVHTR